MTEYLKHNDEETEEEHAVRLRRISEEVKADIKAGRYKHGQLHPEISAKQVKELDLYKNKLRDLSSWQLEIMNMLIRKTPDWTPTGRYRDAALYGKSMDLVAYDEYYHTPIETWMPVSKTPRESKPDSHDWEHPIPTKGPETPPSDAKRAALRTKRKRRK